MLAMALGLALFGKRGMRHGWRGLNVMCSIPHWGPTSHAGGRPRGSQPDQCEFWLTNYLIFSQNRPGKISFSGTTAAQIHGYFESLIFSLKN